MDTNTITPILILPDIHGRNFWKKYNPIKYDKIIFLGDYMDPYPDEGIEYTQAFNNFKEIIELKKKYDKKVILLLGNHDLHYLDIIGETVRYDRFHAKQISWLLADNLKLFQLSYQTTIKVGEEEKNFFFSHAGIHEDWLNYALKGKKIIPENISEQINCLFETRDELFITALDNVSYIRGGRDNFGSMVWADILEFDKDDVPLLDRYFQIVGHTMLSIPFTIKNIACIDVQRGFLLNEKGKITEDDGEEITRALTSDEKSKS